MTHVSVPLGCHFRCEQQLIQKSQQHQKIESHVCEPGGDEWNGLVRFFWFFLLFPNGEPGLSRTCTSLIHNVSICVDLSITLLKFLHVSQIRTKITVKKKTKLIFLFVHQQFCWQETRIEMKSYFFFCVENSHESTNTRALLVIEHIAHTIVVPKPLAFAQ